MTSGPFAPAGWYADPAGEHASRYWDGTAWTDHVSEAPPTHPTGSGGGAARTTGGTVVKFLAVLYGLLTASSLAMVLFVGIFGPERADYGSQAAYEQAFNRSVSEFQIVGLLVVFSAVAFVAPKVGYRTRDIGFMLVPIWSVVFLVRILWRFAHLPEIYWSTRPPGS
ncbi:MAG: DUF2510 domain-containing protein [Actinomycetota bacterium]